MQADIVFVGAGLAARIAALRLAALPKPPRVLMVDPSPPQNHTWSFHEHDITPQDRRWLSPAIAHEWPGQDVRFPGHSRTLRAGYATITPTSLPATNLLRETVTHIAPDHVIAGHRIDAQCVIDARGFSPHPALEIGFQKFLGQEVELAAPHGLTLPVIMDATVPQEGGYRFVYLLPFSPTRLLIEDTRYADTPGLEGLREGVAAYAAAQGWQIRAVLREETGALPIALSFDAAAFWRDATVPPIGMRAARFHPVTGYSLPDAVRSANVIAKHWQGNLGAALREDAIARDRPFYRLLTRMLFRAADPTDRWRVLERFYRLPEPLIERFYAGNTTQADMARILIGKPPVPILRAIRALPERRQNA
ncbi:lycopene beta-cyclase CrtY [Cereibacter sp. SYSU M97828]|nr:lycopene beta-cyclase CrtY [Cereibacter flavus]